MTGDGDPREYGGTLPDGRRWVHPPYGPVEVSESLFPPAPRRRWWRPTRRRLDRHIRQILHTGLAGFSLHSESMSHVNQALLDRDTGGALHLARLARVPSSDPAAVERWRQAISEAERLAAR